MLLLTIEVAGRAARPRNAVIAVLAALASALASGCAELGKPPTQSTVGPTSSAAPTSSSAPASGPATSAPSSAPTHAPPTGLRFKLAGGAAVYVPENFVALNAPDIVVHFHGVATVTEREFAAARAPAVLLTVNYNGLSAAYEKPLADPALFGDLLDETLTELKSRGVLPVSAKWRRVCVSSFSAGFGAVRALLKQPRYYRLIDALYLADTIYAGYTEVDGQNRVAPENMKDFRRFAADAAAERKWMLITHSYLEPGKYAGTHETADDLIAHVGAARREVDETFAGDAGSAPLYIVSRVDIGRFFVRGCVGKTGEDHMAHLRNLRYGYALIPAGRQ